MNRIAIIVAVVLATLAAASVGALALASGTVAGKLPEGSKISGVAVGGLTKDEALALANRRVAALITRPVYVQLGEKRYTLTAQQANVKVDIRRPVEQLYAAGEKGSFLKRGFREITGEKSKSNLPANVTINRSAIGAFIGRIEKEQALKPVDAGIKLTLTKVSVSPSKAGRRLAARDALMARIARRLTTSTNRRTLRAKTIKTKAKLTADKVFDANPVAVTVSRNETKVRVFSRGKLVKTYTVAVGSPEYPSPTGQYVVQTKQVNPAWNVPNSAWAGSLAGQTIPGGAPNNPLVARWIGFNGSVGFHGTASAGSLGSAASHGCIRMAPPDVIELFKRVKLGTPVLVA